jgi:hypothetical protein
MPSAPATPDATAAVRLRAAAFTVAREFSDDRRRLFILRHLGERIEELEAGSETAVCATCRRYFTYDPKFYWSRALEAPTHCTCCRILRRALDDRAARR